VREISRGIHPAILSEQGLTAALKALARRCTVPVELDLRAGRRLPAQVEVAAYYAVSEALANAVKHSRASVVHVELDASDTTLRLAIRHDGIGEFRRLERDIETLSRQPITPGSPLFAGITSRLLAASTGRGDPRPPAAGRTRWRAPGEDSAR
jgi:hypothetical protein